MEEVKVLVASDSFKGSASSIEVANYIEYGIKKYNANYKVIKSSIADGGEGTLETIVEENHGQYIEVDVRGPRFSKVRAKYGIIEGNKAIIEMAESSGLYLIDKEERDPLYTSTYGLGELILDALDRGVEYIYMGLGGSATNDGGAGMAQALGVKLLDEQARELGLGAKELSRLNKIDISGLDKRLLKTKFILLSDVNNPLCGENGASHIFGPQKGARKEDLDFLDRTLWNYGRKLEKLFNIELINKPGSGAAGGLGAGMMAFCRGEFKSGIDSIIDLISLEDKIQDVDLVITGEGNLDAQSLQGKAPIGVAKLAKKYKLPVIAIVGGRADNIDQVYKEGIDLVIDIVNKPMDIEESMDRVGPLLKIAGENAIRAFSL